ncbi:MAG: D-aminoacyl-tRNA deacylase [Bacteriovoracaceae bacterium]
MKMVIQRAKKSSVTVEGVVVGEIDHGLVVFVCFENGDNEEIIDQAVYKVVNLRIFEDEKEKMMFNVSQVQGQILSISQFTLSWDGSRGHRPSFDRSMNPSEAKMMYAIFNKKLKELVPTAVGKFGANMMVSVQNDGPVTFTLAFPSQN